MSALTPDQLAYMRTSTVGQLLPDTCTIPRESPGAVNPDGSFEPGTVVTATYACRVGPLGGSPMEQTIAARLEGVTGFVVTLPYDANVNEKDTITYGDQTLQVIGVLNPRSFQTAIRVACRRIG